MGWKASVIILAKLIAVGLLFRALDEARNPDSDTLLRPVIFGVGLVDAFMAYRRDLKLCAIVSTIIALLYNPFIPPAPSQAGWILLTSSAALYLLASIVIVNRPPDAPPDPNEKSANPPKAI